MSPEKVRSRRQLRTDPARAARLVWLEAALPRAAHLATRLPEGPRLAGHCGSSGRSIDGWLFPSRVADRSTLAKLGRPASQRLRSLSRLGLITATFRTKGRRLLFSSAYDKEVLSSPPWSCAPHMAVWGMQLQPSPIISRSHERNSVFSSVPAASEPASVERSVSPAQARRAELVQGPALLLAAGALIPHGHRRRVVVTGLLLRLTGTPFGQISHRTFSISLLGSH
jgi:hypothetical protein